MAVIIQHLNTSTPQRQLLHQHILSNYCLQNDAIKQAERYRMHRRRQMQQLETHAVPTNHLKIAIQTNYKTKHALTPNINTKIQKHYQL